MLSLEAQRQGQCEATTSWPVCCSPPAPPLALLPQDRQALFCSKAAWSCSSCLARTAALPSQEEQGKGKPRQEGLELWSESICIPALSATRSALPWAVEVEVALPWDSSVSTGFGPTASQQSSLQPPVPQLAQYVMQPEGFNLVLEIN